METAIVNHPNGTAGNDQRLAMMKVQDLMAQVATIQEVMRSVMHEGQHFGKVPGCGDKPTLLKPGAEKLAFVFRLAPEFSIQQEDLPGGHRTYTITCTMRQIGTNTVLGQGVGVGSTMEAKYRFRSGPKVSTGKPVPKEYWDLRSSNPAKAQELIGGKGYATAKNDQGVWEIVEQGTKVEHDNPADHYNTVLKMAKKRAQIDATLTCTAASDCFTQDLEDIQDNLKAYDVIAHATKVEPLPVVQNGSAPQQTESKPVQAPVATQTPKTENTGHSGQGTAPAAGNWRDHELHFSKHKGKRLGELEPKSLRWFINDWQPQGFNGRPPSAKDMALRQALNAASSELNGAAPAQDLDQEAPPAPAAKAPDLDEDVPF